MWEARVIREAAARARVATQMGTQIHAGNNFRRVVELIQTGAIGPVREAHVWVSRAWGWQPSEEESKRARDIVFVQDSERVLGEGGCGDVKGVRWGWDLRWRLHSRSFGMTRKGY